MSENIEKKKQVSLVLEAEFSYNEIQFLKDFKKFLLKYPELQIVGTHIKKKENFR